MHLARLCVPLLLLAACDEATAPEGKTADVQVRVYTDLDNSGSFTTADAAISNVSLALLDNTTADRAVVAEATTGADGIATFKVKPGSYTVRVPESGPGGAVLASSSEPRIVVSALGTYTAGDVRYAYLPATISGRIFRDDNGNGVFDPTSDTPGAGLAVVLRRELASAPGERVDSVVTDATGAYQFRFLRPGAYYTVLENPSGINYGTSGATRRVQVTPGTVVPTTAVFTGALIVDVATARARTAGQLVAVQGNLTVAPNVFTSGANGMNSEIWVQDATGGIAAFSILSSESANFAPGDRVELTGTRGVNAGQIQLTTPRLVKLGAGTAPAPLAQTVAQALALTNEGRLVTLPGVRVTTVQTGTAAAFNVTVADASGVEMTIRAAALGLTRAAFNVGDRYAITGILTQFNGVAQLKPRSAADVAPAVATIASARAAAAGTVITVGGNITVPPNLFTSGTNGVNSEIWVQDATGGIAAFSVLSTESSNFVLGDRVELTGTRGVNAGQIQLTTPTLVKTAAGTAPAPLVITGTQANALTNDGRLVTVNGYTVTTVGTGTGAAFNVTGTTPDGATVTVRVSSLNTGLTRANFTVGQTYTVTGILTQFNGAAQIKLRLRTDVTP